MMIVGDEAHLMDIAVAPEYRGQQFRMPGSWMLLV